ncbi:MAG: glycosyltransferase [Mastigocoleus sp.]
MKILCLTTVLPSQKKTGGEIASQAFIDALEESGHKVSVIGYQRLEDNWEPQPREICIGKRHIETNKSGWCQLLWMGLGAVKNMPYSAAKYYSHTYIEKVRHVLDQGNYDLILLDHAQLGWLRNIIQDKVKSIFNAHNIEHEIYLSHLENAQGYVSQHIYRREAKLIKHMEDSLASSSSSVWTLTSHDSKYFRNVSQDNRVFHIPSSLTPSPTVSISKDYDIGLVGSWTWKANMAGLNWFFQKVYPSLPKDLSIHVAGKGAQWLKGQYPNVIYHGFVPNIESFMRRGKVMAIPSISGGGVQIKTLDAIALGSSIVATPVAMRGISQYPASVRVAATSEDFAQSLIESLNMKNTPDFYEEAIAWSQQRRIVFFTDVKNAILALN